MQDSISYALAQICMTMMMHLGDPTQRLSGDAHLLHDFENYVLEVQVVSCFVHAVASHGLIENLNKT